MHINLTPIDWIILAVYLAGCMGAGLWMRRFVHGVEDFAIAGRVVNTYLGIASLAATEMGLVTVMYTAQLAEAVYVLHAFQKKTQATSKRDIDLARRRWTELMKEAR